VSRWHSRAEPFFKKLRRRHRKLDDKKLLQQIVEFLRDEPRRGAHPIYTPEQICQIVALALENPAERSERPISHWTTRELAHEAQKRKIVPRISARTVGRFLNEADLKPHKFKYWLNPVIDDPVAYANSINAICEAYSMAIKNFQNGIHTISTDEKTGVQALEHLHPRKPMRPGLLERIEFEYVRHGSVCLIPSFEIATGKIVKATIGPTRTEEDFLQHIAATIDTDPQAPWIFVADRLNTHMSESLVKLVAQRCGIKDDLGIKRKRGILKSMKSRANFLTDPDHRIRFIYTPKHSSWMNQIEIWFSILARKLLKRASFTSTEDLTQRILDFIEYFNETMSKPFKWTYKGKPLKA
jgi:transposase